MILFVNLNRPLWALFQNFKVNLSFQLVWRLVSLSQRKSKSIPLWFSANWQEVVHRIAAKNLPQIICLAYIIFTPVLQITVLYVLNRGLVLCRQHPVKLDKYRYDHKDYWVQYITNKNEHLLVEVIVVFWLEFIAEAPFQRTHEVFQQCYLDEYCYYLRIQ